MQIDVIVDNSCKRTIKDLVTETRNSVDNKISALISSVT